MNSQPELVPILGLSGERRDYIAYPKAIPPYPASEYIAGVKFDRFRYHCGEGDMWPLTWGADDCIYTAAGDNKGSPLNVWKVSQYAAWRGDQVIHLDKLTNTNDWTIDLVHPMPVDPAKYCTRPEAPSVKPASLLDIGGRLYMAVEAQNYGQNPLFNRQTNHHGWIVFSDDGGKTWNTDATAPDFFEGRVASCHFLQFGRGFSGARDEYVYAYFPCDEDGWSYWENGDFLLLGRVPAGRLLERSAWEFFAAPGDWRRDALLAQPVFTYYKMTGEDNVCFNPGLNRYILANYSFIDDELRPRPIHQMRWPEAYRSQLTLFEAENPWGPWHLFYRDDFWGTYGDYQPSIPTKWIFEGGRLMFLVSSGSWDDYNFVVQKMAVRLKGEADFPASAQYFDFPIARPATFV